jgi:GT2 family glycosyltransferase
MQIKYDFGYEEVSVYANVVRLITQRAKSGSLHIDLGCGNAAIAGVLQQQGIEYLGFDGDSETVARLTARGLEAYPIDLNQSKDAIQAIFSRARNRQIASISMIDVIEHLDNAQEFLHLLALESQKRGSFVLITSVPNFAHADVSTKLMSGSWDYTETGLLDRTHRVIYTETNLIQLTKAAGWQPIAAQDYRLEVTEQRALPTPNPLRASGGTDFLLRQLKSKIDPLYNVYQFVRAFEASTATTTATPHPIRPCVSIAVSTLEDLDAFAALFADAMWLDQLPCPLQLILPASLGTHQVQIQSPMLILRRLGPEETLERAITGRHLLHFTRQSQWHFEAFSLAIAFLQDATLEEVVHAGSGHPHLGSSFADWLEVARTLTIIGIERSFYPLSYIKHYQDPAPKEMDHSARAEHYLRAAARVGIKHLNLLNSNPSKDVCLTDTWSYMGLIEPLSAYHLFILNGKIPDAVFKLQAELIASKNSIVDITEQLRNATNVIFEKSDQLIAANNLIHDKSDQLIAANNLIQDKSDQLIAANNLIHDKSDQLIAANNLVHEKSLQIKQRDDEILIKTQLLSETTHHLNDLEHHLVAAQLRLTWLEQELVNTRKTLSWRLTSPLRVWSRTYQRIFKSGSNHPVANTLFDRAKTKVHRKLTDLFHRAQDWVVARSSSPDNLLAVQALSARRFDETLALRNQPSTLNEQPTVDVSVVSYNSSKWVDNFMMSLISQKYPLDKLHFVVVDHGSTDSTLDQLKQWQTRVGAKFARFEIIQQPNLGFGAGHHRAIATGHSDYCLVTNLDLEFPNHAILNVVNAALCDKHQKVASWEMRQIPYEHPKYYDPVTLETNWSSHACILISRSAYQTVGGYDDRIFMYAEDVEMSYRFRSHGFALKYVPQAPVRHFSYEQAGEVKPLQFLGSVLGNNYIRMRYGRTKDTIIGLLMYGLRFVFPVPFPGARRALFKNTSKLLRNSPHFLAGKGAHPVYYPLRGYDYEMIRDGAFWPIQELPTQEQLPRVTVITRTYQGRGALLTQAILSVFNQTYPHIELIVVEDGGDTQKALVERMSAIAPEHIQIHFLANPKLGRSAAGNRALSQATGHFMMFLDDDDLLFADHLEILSNPMLKDESLAACYALAYEVSTEMADDKSNYSEFNFQTTSIMRQEWDYEVLRHHNFIPIQAILFRRSLFEKHGGFDTELEQLEDWNLWLRYGHQQRFQFIPKTTSYYRTPANASVRADRHQLLHEAYELAQSRALQALKNNASL